MPVGTQGAVKAVLPRDVAATGAQVLLANTYHLSLEDRTELVERAGGLHSFMAWERTLLTDSGGFQVFSLPGREVSEDGVSFPGEKGGPRLMLDPEGSLDIQRRLGADIVMAFDECVAHDAARRYVEASVERTARWARRCRAPAGSTSRLRHVQGGLPDICARAAADRGLDSTARPSASRRARPRAHGAVVPPPRRFARTAATSWAWAARGHPVRHRAGHGHTTRIPGAARGGTPSRARGRPYRRQGLPARRLACGPPLQVHGLRVLPRAVPRHPHYAHEPVLETLASVHNLQSYRDLRPRRDEIERGRFAGRKRACLRRYGA